MKRICLCKIIFLNQNKGHFFSIFLNNGGWVHKSYIRKISGRGVQKACIRTGPSFLQWKHIKWISWNGLQAFLLGYPASTATERAKKIIKRGRVGKHDKINPFPCLNSSWDLNQITCSTYYFKLGFLTENSKSKTIYFSKKNSKCRNCVELLRRVWENPTVYSTGKVQLQYNYHANPFVLNVAHHS